jgi:O-antigen/teichoic acid export membrane protein
MKRIDDVREVNRSILGHLFDQDGLPWTSRLQWGVLLFWVAALLFVFAPLIGIYLGLWLISKRRSALALILYLVLAVMSVPALFAPFPTYSWAIETFLGLSFLALWLVGVFVLRREVMRYYSDREGIPFPLNPVLTAIFGPWYVGGHLRADFPLDDSGKVGTGVMRLIV